MFRTSVFAFLAVAALSASAVAAHADATDAKIVKLTSAAPRLFHEDGSPAPNAKLPALPVQIVEIADGRYKVRGDDGQIYIVRALDVIVTGVCGDDAAASGSIATRPQGRAVAGVTAGAGRGC